MCDVRHAGKQAVVNSLLEAKHASGKYVALCIPFLVQVKIRFDNIFCACCGLALRSAHVHI